MLTFDKLNVGDYKLKNFFSLKLLEDKVWLAGGALRGQFTTISEKISDFDLFFGSKQHLTKTKEKIEQQKHKKIFECPLGLLTTYVVEIDKNAGKRPNDPSREIQSDAYNKLKIQCISESFYLDMKHLIDQFDINACRLAYDGSKLVTVYSAIRDIKKRQITLNPNGVKFPNATMKRIGKYIAKDYKLTNSGIETFTSVVYGFGLAHLDLNGRFYID